MDGQAGLPQLEAGPVDDERLDLVLFLPLRGLFLVLGGLGLGLLLLDLLEQGGLLLGQAEAVPGLAGEEERVGVELRPAALGRALEAVAIAGPHHGLAAQDPLGPAVLEAALAQVDGLGRAVGLDQAHFARREAGHGELEQDPAAVRAPLEGLAGVGRRGQLLRGQERARRLRGDVQDLEGRPVLDEGQLLAVGRIGGRGVLMGAHDERLLLEDGRGVEVGLLGPRAARLVDAPAAVALRGVENGVAVGGERDRRLLAGRRGDPFGHAAVDVGDEDAAAGDDGDLLAVGRDGELAGPAADRNDDLVVGPGVGGQGDGDLAGLGALAHGVDPAVVAEAQRAVGGHADEPHGVGFELRDRDRRAAALAQAMDVEGAALLG